MVFSRDGVMPAPLWRRALGLVREGAVWHEVAGFDLILFGCEFASPYYTIVSIKRKKRPLLNMDIMRIYEENLF